jgi:hypothetical protein
MWEAHTIKTTCASHMPRDTCHFYMWVVGISYKPICKKFLSLKKWMKPRRNDQFGISVYDRYHLW